MISFIRITSHDLELAALLLQWLESRKILLRAAEVYQYNTIMETARSILENEVQNI